MLGSDFIFVYPIEIIASSDRAEEFKKLKCQGIGASVDSHFRHLVWVNISKKQAGLGPVNWWYHTPNVPSLRTMEALRLMKGSCASLPLTIKGTLQQITMKTSLLATLWMRLRLVEFTDKHGEVWQ